jgi:crotonobetainyl-CoA:carnitine CoA-transferase CaiB-like acyl-CoA transferase
MAPNGDSALAGRRVLELADEKGVYCGKLFADMGADVIKIERPGGDSTREIPPYWQDEPHPERSLFFLYMNTSKRGVTLDITRPEGQALFKRLAKSADIIVETFPPGHLDDLGLGYGTLKEENPRLVLTSITGFGQTGPHKRFTSSDIVASALGGGMYVTGEEEDPPVTLAGSQAHIMASVCAAASSMIALYHSSMSGEGQHIDISLEETTVSVTHICGVGKWLDDNIIPRRAGTSLFASVPSGAYPCKDGLVYLIRFSRAHRRTDRSIGSSWMCTSPTSPRSTPSMKSIMRVRDGTSPSHRLTPLLRSPRTLISPPGTTSYRWKTREPADSASRAHLIATLKLPGRSRAPHPALVNITTRSTALS